MAFIIPDLDLGELWDNLITGDEKIEGETATNIAGINAAANANAATQIASINAAATINIVLIIAGTIGFGLLIYGISQIFK